MIKNENKNRGIKPLSKTPDTPGKTICKIQQRKKAAPIRVSVILLICISVIICRAAFLSNYGFSDSF
jgi:hypothetical protein